MEWRQAGCAGNIGRAGTIANTEGARGRRRWSSADSPGPNWDDSRSQRRARGPSIPKADLSGDRRCNGSIFTSEARHTMSFVCPECIVEPTLAEFIRANASSKECTYCEQSSDEPIALSLDELLEYIRERIEVEYEDAANSVGYETAEGGYLLPTMDGHKLLAAVGLAVFVKDVSLLDDLASPFHDTPWVHRHAYSLTEEQARRLAWTHFATLVKHRVRYMQFPPEEPDDEEITAPSEMLDELGDLFVTHDLFTNLEPGTELFRVRIHKPGSAPANSQDEMGPPPVEAARYANRMSPAGVSMFYGSLDEATALAETYVRYDATPAEATIAVFRVTERIPVLNLVDVPPIPSFFGSDEANLHRAAVSFLHDFNADLTKSIAKDGREHIEYVPSQIVTEYVRYRLPEKAHRQVKGIVYRSARRRKGIGCVLFFAHEDITLKDYGPRVKAPFELLSGRTRTIAIDTSNPPRGDDDWLTSPE
jgi:hypothetical protein